MRARRAVSAMVAEVLLALGAGDLVDVRQQVLERAELLEQLGAGLQADAGDARDVVDGVAGQGEQVDDLVGADAPVGLQAGDVEDLCLRRLKIRIWSSSSCRASLSAVQMKTSSPRSARRAGPGWRSRRRPPSPPGSGPGRETPRTPGGSPGSAASGRRASRRAGPCSRRTAPSGRPAPGRRTRRPGSRACGRGQVEQVAEDPEDRVRRLARRLGHQRRSRGRPGRSARRRRGCKASASVSWEGQAQEEGDREEHADDRHARTQGCRKTGRPEGERTGAGKS